MRPQHRKFAAEYVRNGFNGVQAVFAAGYTQGYNSACVQASRLLRNAKVMDEILQAGEVLTDDEILRELSLVARASVDLKGSDKLKGLELLAKHRGLIKERVETTDTSERDASVIAITESIERAVTRSQSSPDAAAIQLYNSLDSASPARDLTHWGKYADIIRADQRERAAQAVEPTEIGDQ